MAGTRPARCQSRTVDGFTRSLSASSVAVRRSSRMVCIVGSSGKVRDLRSPHPYPDGYAFQTMHNACIIKACLDLGHA